MANLGFLAALGAALAWGTYMVPFKKSKSSNFIQFQAVIAVGIGFSGLIIFVIKRARFKAEAIKESLLSGLIWNVGNLLSLISLSIIGLSKMGPISQSATLVAVLWGLFYFKEITNLRAKRQVLIGAAILFAGVITLGFA